MDEIKLNTLDKIPCKFDHNGECLIYDCWPEHCAYMRYLNKDYKWETEDQLEKMFKNFENERNFT